MSLPTFDSVREKIEAIPNLGLQRLYQGVFITGARIGEFAGLAYPSDKGQPTGKFLNVSEEIYTVDMYNVDDISALRTISLVEKGYECSKEEIVKIKEPVAIFHITTEKRHGFIRHTALPLNPKYDIGGWNKKVYEYPVALEIFKTFTYPIVTYKSNQGRLINAHQKNFANHALRHLRATELRSRYRIKGDMLDAILGWTKTKGAGGSAMQDRYVLEPWREAGYFPKLMREWT
jgi:hypothetical protein